MAELLDRAQRVPHLDHEQVLTVVQYAQGHAVAIEDTYTRRRQVVHLDEDLTQIRSVCDEAAFDEVAPHHHFQRRVSSFELLGEQDEVLGRQIRLTAQHHDLVLARE